MDALTSVATKYGLSIADLRGRSQKRNIVLARREVIRLLHDKGLSLRAIGRILARDHKVVVQVLRLQ